MTAGEFARPIILRSITWFQAMAKASGAIVPIFETHSEDPSWSCKHILAVQNYQAKTQVKQTPENYEDAERAAIQAETVPQPQSPDFRKPEARMLVKRSLSPDGRIDSISLEFSFDVREESAGDIKSRALKALKLQTEIVQSFIG
jgi:hypothetical protein